jgi:hypothetical protein
MAWIESHQTLREHPKVYALMDALGIGKAQAIGHLHLLWWWCVDYSPDGVMKHNDSQIARAGEWTGDPAVFVEAVVAAGFLDRGDGVLTVHDWLEFCGPLIVKRLERKDERRTMSAERRTKLAEVMPTQPTQPNLTNQTKDIRPPDPPIPAEKPKNDQPTPEMLVDFWNRSAHPNLPRIKVLTDTRKRHITARLRDNPDKKFWMETIERVNKSQFLRGEGKSRDNGPPWRADFDWVLNPQNLAKITEGNYDNR